MSNFTTVAFNTSPTWSYIFPREKRTPTVPRLSVVGRGTWRGPVSFAWFFVECHFCAPFDLCESCNSPLPHKCVYHIHLPPPSLHSRTFPRNLSGALSLGLRLVCIEKWSLLFTDSHYFGFLDSFMRRTLVISTRNLEGRLFTLVY